MNLERYFDREQQALQRRLDDGEIDQGQYNRDLRELEREILDAAREEEMERRDSWDREHGY